MRRLLRWLACTALLLAVAVVLYAACALWAWRDLPAAELDRRYGDAALRSVTLDGLAVRYRIEGQGPALVLVHSHYLDMRMWDGWMPALTPHFRVLRFDLAGHGLTGPAPDGNYTVPRDVERLESLLAHLGIDKLSIAGSSLGGNIAFTFAARHPQRVRHLVLINSGGLKRAGSRSGREIPAWADAVMPLVPPAALRAFLRWMVADDLAIDAALETRFVDLWRREGNRPAELARLRQYETGDPDPLLAAITAPTLIQWGEANPQLPMALAEAFAGKLSAAPRVERKVYAGAGHVLPVERPAESVADALAFLQAAP